MSKKLETLVEELSQLTVLEMSELKQQLEDKWGVTAAAPAAAVFAAPEQGGAKEEEATDFNVILEEVPAAKKIAVIKIIREITGLGLKEAKEMAESTPKPVKESAPKEEAEELKKKFEEAGAKVSLKAV
ncbi:MAG: 50S ribosomal protein L7/L12 [Waddliaceae bacterium]